MRERRPLFGYGLQRSGMSAVYHSVCERVDFSIRFDTLWHSCGISTRQWKGYIGITLNVPDFNIFVANMAQGLISLRKSHLNIQSLKIKMILTFE